MSTTSDSSYFEDRAFALDPQAILDLHDEYAGPDDLTAAARLAHFCNVANPAMFMAWLSGVYQDSYVDGVVTVLRHARQASVIQPTRNRLGDPLTAAQRGANLAVSGAIAAMERLTAEDQEEAYGHAAWWAGYAAGALALAAT